MFRKRQIVFCFALIFVQACGDSETTTEIAPIPVVVRVIPAQAAPGEAIVVQGNQFSPIAAENVLILGEASTVAEEFEILDDPHEGASEVLHFEVPDEAAAGSVDLLVLTGEVVSNAVDFTVE